MTQRRAALCPQNRNGLHEYELPSRRGRYFLASEAPILQDFPAVYLLYCRRKSTSHPQRFGGLHTVDFAAALLISVFRNLIKGQNDAALYISAFETLENGVDRIKWLALYVGFDLALRGKLQRLP